MRAQLHELPEDARSPRAALQGQALCEVVERLALDPQQARAIVVENDVVRAPAVFGVFLPQPRTEASAFVKHGAFRAHARGRIAHARNLVRDEPRLRDVNQNPHARSGIPPGVAFLPKSHKAEPPRCSR